MYERTRYLGDGEEPEKREPEGPSVGEVARKAATAAMLYHGYKRSGSVLVALLYGIAGRTVPQIAVPIALAQGFGKKKECP